MHRHFAPACQRMDKTPMRTDRMRSMDGFAHIATHVLEHSLADTLYLIPFLYLTYLLMEWLEHKTGTRTQDAIRHAGAAGPVIGALLGVVPQCGFSAVSATLYAGRVITLGTLFAVFLSTSDEMLPIFLAERVPLPQIASIMGAKVIVGMLMGFLVDAILRLARRYNQSLKIHEICEHDHCGCGPECATCVERPELVYEHAEDCARGCTHEHHAHEHAHDDHGWKGILISALKHTLQVMVFIFLITVVLNTIIEVVGEDALGAFLSSNEVLSIFGSALVGLIPNCAASIVIADLYVEGILGAPAMFAGLLVSAGVGLLVLVRTNHHWKQNVAIIAVLYATGVLWGFVALAFGVTF